MKSRARDPDSQNMLILAHLAQGFRITPLEALRRFGAGRLASRIFELKAKGYLIEKDMVKVPSGARVAEYRLPLQRRKAK